MVELEVIPSCRHYRLGLIPWSPLGGGLRGGVLGKLDAIFPGPGGEAPKADAW